ncbi:micro-fibrillar-associated protein 1 [Calycina marina]|uniref:Micro-fibrillar-associated protein 1 n=1 Tax=Calycina marina TaxID=1763456 RepID=A0A9P7Z6Y5_9HELO|nr:micro-fibrillar-associated protein 1 [Calycina marina]
MSSKRMTANPVKPSRYRPNKIVEEKDSSDSEPGEEEVARSSKPPPKVPSAKGITTNLSRLDVAERRKIAAAVESARLGEEKLLRAKAEEGFETASEEESEDGSGSEEDSSEEESEEEEAPRKVMLRPTFIKKDKRKTIAQLKDTRTEEDFAADEEEEEEKRKDAIVEAALKEDREKKAVEEQRLRKDKFMTSAQEDSDVDTDDDVEQEVAKALWRLREMGRFKREREAIEEKEKEIAELERRRALTSEERKLEDEEHVAKQKDEKESKDKMGFMQKYYHKGAYYVEGLENRNLMGAKFADDVDRELLPKALQMRDMTKIGKRGATKYKDLKSEDTGMTGGYLNDRGPRKGGYQGHSQDDRFRPDSHRDGAGASGANSMPVAEQKRVDNAPEGPKAMRSRAEGDSYRPSSRDQRESSRSRSPRRGRDRDHRKRSYSRERSYRASDKRRRVD